MHEARHERGKTSRRSTIFTTATRSRAPRRRSALVSAALVAALGLSLTPLVAYADSKEELEDIKEKIEQTNQEYDDAVNRVSELEEQISANSQRISEIEQQLPEARERASESMRTLYRMQQTSTGIVELILSSDNFYDLLTTIQYLDVIQNHSNDAVEELNNLSTELAQTQSSLDIQKKQAEKEQANVQETLDEAIEARERLEEEIAAQAAAEAAARQAALEEAIRAVEAAKARQEQERAEAEAAAQANPTNPDAADDQSGSDDTSFTTESGEQVEVQIPESANPSEVDWQSDRETFISEWTPRIDAFLAGSPLDGQGATFAGAAWDNGCDPRLSPSIAMVESSLGRYCFLPHNAWGWGSSSWSSWEEAIYAHAEGLAAGYDGHLTLEGAKKYCPPNWAYWYLTVLSCMEQI